VVTLKSNLRWSLSRNKPLDTENFCSTREDERARHGAHTH
jgi:hypothetical protein